MRVNSINYMSSYSPKTNKSFGHTAVPYPEFEYAYNQQNNQPSVARRFVEKFSALFTPEITQKSQEIKSSINKIYDKPGKTQDFNANPHKQLLSVFA